MIDFIKECIFISIKAGIGSFIIGIIIISILFYPCKMVGFNLFKRRRLPDYRKYY